MPKLDFARIAAAALASAESLLREWLPDGHREGHEWKALNPTRADGHAGSFSINLNTGAWGDFATDAKGGDLVSLYAYLQGIKQGAAAKRLALQLGIAREPTAPRADTKGLAAGTAAAKGGTSTPEGEPARRASRSEWTPILPAPADAEPLPKAHPVRGRPEGFWPYLDVDGATLGAVYRFRTSSGGKEVLPCVFAQHPNGAREWRWLGFPEPRPLYGLDRLAAQPDRTVLVVEGEKCVQAAHGLIGDTALVPCTWPGGAKAVGKADWTPLRGRKVVIWPDCDAQLDKAGERRPEAAQPGIKAAEAIAAKLHELGCQVRIVRIPAPGAKPDGWDVADAIAEGWSRDDVLSFIRDNLRAPACAAEGDPPQHPASPPDDDWQRDLVRGGNGAILAVPANAYLMLVHRPEWREVLAFDEFAQRPVKRMPPPYERGVAGDWDEMDDSFTALWLATRAGLARISSAAAAEAAEMAARAAPFDPVRGHLESLTHDGTSRVDHWLVDYFGVPASEYARLVGRFWLIGMVSRAFDPGCKFDYMPILEGPQGRGKSTALEILAHPWFGNTDFVMGDKDSMAVMQGKWVYEIAELDSFSKADTTRVKSFVSRQVDEFRPAYGRRVLRLPRRVVLVGTTNQFEYFKDSTGNRRFWPIQCREQINLDGLRAARDQLLAEAVQLHRAGERCYPTREEQERYITPEQERREIHDAWEEGIHRYLEEPNVDGHRVDRCSSYDILVSGLKIDNGKITREMTTRVGLVMRRLGWNKVEHRGAHPRYAYERPEKSASDDSAPSEASDDVPI